MAEMRLGVCLLAERYYDKAKSRLILAYNGLKPHGKSVIPANTSDLGWIIEQVRQLRDKSGSPLKDASLTKLQGDPAIQAIIFDLEFPANPFAP